MYFTNKIKFKVINYDLHTYLKPFQNKKGKKFSTCTVFGVFFSAVKKDTENGAPGNFFGPSYLVMALLKLFT